MNSKANDLKEFHETERMVILPFLEKEFGEIESTHILGQGIDQGVEIYSYLVNYKYVIEFDLSTNDNSINKNEILTISDYEKTLVGKGRIKKEARDHLHKLMSKK